MTLELPQHGRTLPGLDALSREAREALRDVSQEASFEADQVVVREGHVPLSFFAVREGRVRMTRSTPAGKNLVLSLLGPGRLFCVPSALAGSPAPATFVAAEPTVLLRIQGDLFFDLLARKPRLARDYLPALVRGLSECTNCIVEAAARPVEARLAYLMLQLADDAGHQDNGAVHIPVPMSRRELSDMVGAATETTIRVMSRWDKEGVVLTLEDGFRIPDRGVLEEKAAE